MERCLLRRDDLEPPLLADNFGNDGEMELVIVVLGVGGESEGSSGSKNV